MASWYESAIDRQLREAAERGEFDNLAGSGKPLTDHGREYDDDWWVKDWLRREGATAGVIPPTLALRREVEDLPAIVDRLHSEAEVRDRVAGTNERLRKARVGLMDGPPLVLPPFDPDQVVTAWRDRRDKAPERGAGARVPEQRRRD
ncbi:DnaJ family domain-containing protein [Micromonosporaceae bacterium Da 78-11]